MNLDVFEKYNKKKVMKWNDVPLEVAFFIVDHTVLRDVSEYGDSHILTLENKDTPMFNTYVPGRLGQEYLDYMCENEGKKLDWVVSYGMKKSNKKTGKAATEYYDFRMLNAADVKGKMRAEKKRKLAYL